MLDKTRRYMIYMSVTIILAILGNFTSLLLPSLFWGLTYGTLGLVLSVVMETYIELAVKEEPPIQAVFREDKFKETIRKMKGDPSCRSMKTMWCTRIGFAPEYFDEERAMLRRNPRLHIQRLINPDRMEKTNYKAHMKFSKGLSDQGRYEVRNTNLKEFECAIWEYERPTGIERKACLVFNDIVGNTYSIALFLDPTKHEKIRFAVEAMES